MNINFVILLTALFSVSSAKRDLLNPCDQMVLRNIKWDFEEIPAESWLGQPSWYVNCSRRGLTKVPRIPSEVQFLNLGFNVIRRINVGDFSTYSKLILLDLSSNCIKNSPNGGTGPPCLKDFVIEVGALLPLRRLKCLILNSNYLRNFPERLPKSITMLDISTTWLGDVTSQLQHELPNLSALFAEINCSPSVLYLCPRNFTISSKLSSSLAFLDITLNNWQKMPGYLFGKNLTTAYISGNPIKRISKGDFVNATNLQKLHLKQLMTPLRLEHEAIDHLINLETLDLSLNLIETLPPDFFRYNSKLEYLDLFGNCLMLTVIEPNYLAGLTELKYLDVSSNGACYPEKHIPVIPTLQLKPVYSSLKSLEVLMIGMPPKSRFRNKRIEWSMKFKAVNAKSFRVLSKLNISVLSLAGCSVQTIEKGSFQNLTNLKALFFSHNYIDFGKKRGKIGYKRSSNGESLHDVYSDKKPFEIAEVIRVEKPRFEPGVIIDYSYNAITLLADIVTVQLCVVSLDLSHNYIKVITGSDFEDFPYLRNLNLAYNPLEKINPLAFQTLVNLQSLVMIDTILGDDMDISFLHDLSPVSEVNLRWKGSGKNVADFLFNWIKQGQVNETMNSLVSIDISGNNMAWSVVSVKLFSLKIFPSVIVLSVSDCSLSDSISINFFSGLNQLEILDISHNEFRQLPTSFLRNLKKLTEIDVSFNFITDLTLDFFSNLTQLKDFRASRNKISFIEPNIFQHSRLRRLDLSYNDIERLDSSILSKEVLQSLSYLDIRWNELDCYCEVWETFYIWYISDESKMTSLPGFMPTCTAEDDQYYGGCVACQSPWSLFGLSISRNGYNTSCELTTMTAYALSFTAFVFIFLMSGIIGYSKWFKRMVFRKVNDQFRVESLEKSNESATTTNRYLSFVCYDHENQEAGDWVDARLVPTMRKAKPPINLVVSGRDDACSVGRSQQVLRRALQCHKTIVLLTDDFCDSPVCRFLITALQELQYSEGQDRMILVTWYGDRAPRVPELIQRTMNRRRHCFLRFDHANDDEALFFDVLHAQLLSHIKT